MRRAMMERALVRYGGRRAEDLCHADDHVVLVLYEHLKVRMVVPDSSAALQPVNLDDVARAVG